MAKHCGTKRMRRHRRHRGGADDGSLAALVGRIPQGFAATIPAAATATPSIRGGRRRSHRGRRHRKTRRRHH